MQRNTIMAALVAATSLSSSVAYAQSGEVIMRRPIVADRVLATDWQTGEWQTVDGSGNPAPSWCGPARQLREVSCIEVGSGRVLPDKNCKGPKPAGEQNVEDFSGCSYSWIKGDYVDPGSSCDLSEVQVRPVSCQRDQTGDAVDDGFCTTSKPATSRTVEDVSACTYSWDEQAWDLGANSCTQSEPQSRDILCRRDLDNEIVSEGLCNSAERPSDSRTEEDYSACSYAWAPEPWNTGAASCTETETQVRQIKCERIQTGQKVDVSFCSSAAKPASSRVVEDYSNCSYTWEPSSWDEGGASCTNAEEQTRTANCVRSETGQTVGAEFCDPAAEPDLIREVEDLSGCSYSWTASAWDEGAASCTSSEDQSRKISCKRDQTGETVTGALCDAGSKPSSSRSVEDYSACSYSWVAGGWDTGGASCTASESQSRTVSCKRDQTGDTVSGSLCDAGTKPSSTRSVEDYSACSYSWVAGGWDTGGASCTASESQSRTISCKRDQTGEKVSGSLCDAGMKPSSTRSVEDYSGCSYSWTAGSWDTGGASCTATESQGRAISCKRDQTGEKVSGSLCDAGTKPSSTRSVEDYSGCSYSWVAGGWNTGGASCTASESQSRTISCKRDQTGETVSGSFCSAGSKPAASRTVEDYSGCSYSWEAGSWNTGGASCTHTETQVRPISCKRTQTGEAVSGSLCASGSKPASTRVVEDLSGCTYSWGTPSAWNTGSASCTASETQTRTVACLRDQTGESVSSSMCSLSKKPSTTQKVADYSGCDYVWVEGSWSTFSDCVDDRKVRTRSVSCRRSDGATVTDTSLCVNDDGPKPATSDEDVCLSPTNHYRWNVGSWSAWGSCEGAGDPVVGRSPASGDWGPYFTGGTRTRVRPVSCVEERTGNVADSSMCLADSSKPTTTDSSSCGTVELLALGAMGDTYPVTFIDSFGGGCTGSLIARVSESRPKAEYTNDWTYDLRKMSALGATCSINIGYTTSESSPMTRVTEFYDGVWSTSADSSSMYNEWRWSMCRDKINLSNPRDGAVCIYENYSR